MRLGGYTDGKLKEGKDYTDRTLAEAKEELKRSFVDTGEMNRRLAEIQKQIDKEVSNWYYPGAPDRDKEPEKNWSTKEDRDKHVGGYLYLYGTNRLARMQARAGDTQMSTIGSPLSIAIH